MRSIKTTRNFWRTLKIFSLLWVLALTCEAQYTLVSKGDKVFYDSAVVVELSQYRKESTLIHAQTQAIDSLNKQVEGLFEEVSFRKTLELNFDQELHITNEHLLSKDSLISSQQEKINLFYEEAIKPVPLVKKRGFLFSLGILVALLLTK